MRVLVVGGGGREHALAWAIARSPECEALYAAPGNPAMATVAQLAPLEAGDVAGLVRFAQNEAIDLVVVGPEGPLAAGLVDALEAAGVKAFGPSAAAAKLESSKRFAKDFCERHDIPTAAHEAFAADDLEAARAYVRALTDLPVVKRDGLAAGKGVVVAEHRDEALAAIDSAEKAGDGVVIEERLAGVEASLFALCDGKSAIFFADAQDHKRAHDGDKGPNTGGMGAFSPSRALDEAAREQAMREIAQPTLRAMADEGAPFKGFLYCGLMLTEDGPKLIEFNVRMGDPECQAVLPRLRDDLLPLLERAARGALGAARPAFDPRSAVSLVLAAEGYPDDVRIGDPIEGADGFESDKALLFGAGIAADHDGQWRTAGGRVLALAALGDNLEAARASAYEASERIAWRGRWSRSDIAAAEAGSDAAVASEPHED